MILGLGSSITSLRKNPDSLRQCESFCCFLYFAERGTLVTVRVTRKSIATACDTDVIDDEFVCACNVVLVPTLDSRESRESDALNTWTISSNTCLALRGLPSSAIFEKRARFQSIRSYEYLIVRHIFVAKLCTFKISFTKIIRKFKRFRKFACWKTSYVF